MIRHIVLFKLKNGIGKEGREELVESLKGLKGKIPLVRELEVGSDVAGKSNSYDIALNSLFDSFEDVEAYSVHPDHITVVEMVKELCQSSIKVDFEL